MSKGLSDFEMSQQWLRSYQELRNGESDRVMSEWDCGGQRYTLIIAKTLPVQPIDNEKRDGIEGGHSE